MRLERKTIGAAIKAAGDDGSFEAVIATLGEIDKDRDIVEPGAFGDRPASVLPAHDDEHVPLGKTGIEERGNLAVAVGRFNLEIGAARDWHSSLKFDLAHPPAVQEWSWGFRVLEDRQDTVNGMSVRRLVKVDLREVSPVLRGASVGTRTLSVKRLKADGMSIEDLREMLERSLGEAEPGAEWLHVVDVFDDVVVYRRHVENEPARLLERDYTIAGESVTLGDEAREVVMRRRYEPIGKSAPSELTMKLAERLRVATFDVADLVAEVRRTAEGRQEKGRKLGEDVRLGTVQMAQQTSELLDAIAQTIEHHVSPQDQIAKAVARFQATEMLRRGVCP